jgi:hypothetical protein
MTVWTIDAEPYAGGLAVARELAVRAGIPLIDEQFSIALALDLGTTVADARAVERAAAGRLVRLGLLFGASTRCAPELTRELERLRRCRDLFDEVARDASRLPCVIFGRQAYAVLADHPGARHVSIHAPREWRARQLAASSCVPLAEARRRVARADRLRRAGVHRPVFRTLEDWRAFHVVCDASRLTPSTIVELLLALGARESMRRSTAVGTH